ncbi:P-loop containing nucleoside triphosphate hydrolase protein, partial [Exophiala viscosa]
MLVTPHDYQAKGAAQIQHCAEGPFRGMILGDGMGLGKTLTGAMAMNIVRDQPGMCLVVCLAKDRVQWHNTITNSWKEGYGSKSFILRDPRTTACQLLSLGVDVVICSYEYVENSVREAIRNHIKFVKVREARGNLERNLKRPCKTLFSEVYGLTGQLWKRLILDEAQTVSKPGQAKHDAIKKIPAEAIICLTGTLAHNKWHDFWGYIDYFKGHPFESAELFFHAFGNTEGQFADPESKQIRRLQRFMQPLIIARPRETNPLLTLVDRDSYKLCFELHPMCEGLVNEYISKYFRMLRNNKLNGADAWEGKGSRSVRLKCLSYATKAQLASLHPLLLLNIRVKTSTTDAEDGEDHQWSSLEETGGDPAFTSRKQRLAWLELVQSASLRLAEDSERTVHILALYQWCRKHKPQEKIVIFSQYLKFLDIIHQCLERIGVEAIRYDGLVKVTDRPQVEKQFIKADPSVPLLITAGAGGTGLNLQCASIVIQTEVWWNHNTELQAIARCDRQGQKKRVLYVRLFAENSKIDAEYLQVQSRKRKVNEELMKPLIRCHNEGPEILELEDRLPLP